MKYFPRVAIFIISIFVLSFINLRTVHADTLPLYPILTDTTLDSSTTYVVDGMVVVPSGDTLTVPAGTQFIFTSGSYLRVDGTLDTNGTPTKHVTIDGGTPPPAIPVLQTPDTRAPDIAGGPMQYGILFTPGSLGTLAYTDINEAIDGMTVDAGATVDDAHGTFNNCATGILGAGGTVKLTSNAFNNVQLPADWDFHGTFTHSNTTFTNTQLNGWRYGGDITAGQTMKLNSTDGEYSIPNVAVAAGGSLVVSPGVTITVQDNQTVIIGGAFSALGTNDSPITIYGDGNCPSHSPVLDFISNDDAKLEHIDFKNLCNGISVRNGNLKLLADTFDTIAGTAVTASDHAAVNADNITMNDVYQAFYAGSVSQLIIADTAIKTVNAHNPAIAVDDDTPMNLDTVSIDTAPVCIGFSNDASLTAKNLTLNHCSIDGIVSNNNTGSSSITLNDSEIMNSGTALKLADASVTDVSNNKFHDNAVGVALTDMGGSVIANNYWGSNSGPTIDSNPGGTGDSIVLDNSPQVVYRPWIGMTTVVHNPIIIVPGITGSVLDKVYGDDSEIWPNLSKLALSPTDSFLDDLELLQNGTQSIDRPMAVGDIIRSISSADIFSSMIAALTKDGYTEGTDLFVLPYDWRFSNTTSQSLLKDAITNALAKSGKDKVNIIAHSMGGLLVQDYIAQHPDAPIDHLFYIGVPHLGAPKAFQSLMYGDDMGFTFSVLGLHIPLLNAATVKTISQNMPAVYELLPSQKYINSFGSYIIDLTKSAAPLGLSDIQAFMTADGRNAKMFPFAKALHDAADNLDDSKFPTYNFAGCGSTKTIGSYTVTKEQAFSLIGLKLVPEHHIAYVSGDGVVPIKSATAGNGANNYYVSSGSHGTLPSLSPVQNAITAVLDGNAIDATASGISSSTNNCALSGNIVEVHSPVTLDIYDEQGNHTGPTAGDQIEYGIPNVDYEVINDEKFAFLPDGQDYKVVNHAQSVGTYDMYVKHSTGRDTTDLEEYFSQIPVKTANTVGTITIGPSDPSFELDVDENGDGSDIKTFHPVGSDQQSWMNDVTAPTTNAVVAGDAIILSAHDTVSGILNTKYSADNGLTWNIYSDPFEVAPGTTVQYLSLDRAGNTEDLKQITVPQASSQTIVTQTQTAAAPQVPLQTPNNNYYYGDTTITEPPANDASQEDDNTDSSDTNSQTPDTEVVPITPPSSDDVSTPQTIAEHVSAFISSLTGHGADESVTAMNTDQSTGLQQAYGTAKKNLLASLGGVLLTNSTELFVSILAALCAVVAIALTRRYAKRNKADSE